METLKTSLLRQLNTDRFFVFVKTYLFEFHQYNCLKFSFIIKKKKNRKFNLNTSPDRSPVNCLTNLNLFSELLSLHSNDRTDKTQMNSFSRINLLVKKQHNLSLTCACAFRSYPATTLCRQMRCTRQFFTRNENRYEHLF